MLRRIPFRVAAYTLLLLFAAAIAFQLVVIAGFIPTEMVWGGRLKNEQERTVGALVSIAFLVLFALLVLARMGRVMHTIPKIGKWGMW
ncbi:MAG: hypothetical protein JNL43_02190, partial [Flavobacteriales bacterium]|nr:hypothetical protein [Flavobacteriales bacterium]